MDVEPEIVYEKSDGEISSDSEAIAAPYKPLERPSFIHQEIVKSTKIPEYNSDDEISNNSESTNTDSDSEAERYQKRPKLKPKVKSKKQINQKPTNKYTIWNSSAQEDLLTETMVSCDVTKTDRSRDVETYDYPKQRIDLKRKHKDRSNVFRRLGKREVEEENKKGSSRHILDLAVTVENTDDEVALDIANKLYEEKDDLIKNLVSIVGKEKAIEFFNKTKLIEEDGGMLVMNQTRRRTPGGVYFFLVKHDDVLTEEQKKLIFSADLKATSKERNQKRKKAKQAKQAKQAVKKGDLPNLLSRAEMELAKGNNRIRKESEHTENVTNPPPSPVTDGKENSSDEMTDNQETGTSTHKTYQCPVVVNNTRDLQSYDDDFLEIGCDGTDMDFFS